MRRPGELITAVTVPVLDGWQGYAKVGVRNAMVIATATCCLAVDVPTGSVRLALGSVGPVIIRAAEAEAYAAAHADLAGGRASAEVIGASVHWPPTRRGRSTTTARRPTYRRHAIGVLAARLARRAFPHE